MGLYKCNKCGKEYETKDIRYTVDKKFICVYCLDVKKRDVAVKKAPKDEEEMVEYVCGNCKYQFKRKKSFVLRTCPYCDKPKLSVKKGVDAENLIKESEGRQYEQ